MKIIPEDRRIAEARRAFMARLNATPEKHRRAVVEATAVKPIGFGAGQIDPYTAALAANMRESFAIQDRVQAAKQELAEVARQERALADRKASYPTAYIDPNFRARLLTRKADLEATIENGVERYAALKDDSLDDAKTQATAVFDEADAHREREANRREALARAETAAEQEELNRWAADQVAARRSMGSGNTPWGSSEQ